MSKEKICFVPTCFNTVQNSPHKLFVPVIDSLKELWCQKLKVKFNKNSNYYCCEDHLYPEEDIENYQLCKLMNGEPRMKPTAVFRLNTQCKSDVHSDPLTTADVPSDSSKHEASELFRLLLSDDTRPKSNLKFDYSQTMPYLYRVSVGVQCKAKTRDACVSFLGRKNLPIGFKQTSPTYKEVESTNVKSPCCCCLLRSPNSDVRTPYTCDDKTDTYMDMFEECFGIELTLDRDDECGICEECVCRLRDARDFKLQVQRSQQELRARRRVKHETTENYSEMSDNEMYDDELLPSETAVKMEVLEKACQDEKVFITCNEIPLEVCKQESSVSTKQQTSTEHELFTHQAFAEQPTMSTEPERRDVTPHECLICHKAFKRAVGLRNHMRVHAKEKTRVTRDSSEDSELHCDECGKLFKSKLSFTKHIQTHETYKPYTCDICSKEFSREGYLSLHKKSHTREYTCDICKSKFTRKQLLASHMARHMYGKPFACEICNKKFKNKYGLKGHKLLHIKDKLYSCKICNKKFSHINLLKRHNVIHKKGSFICESCGRQFLCLSMYIVHRRIHTGEKPFECGICKKRFASKGNMMLHERTHTGEKPYSCQFCPKRFACSSGLKHHKTVHTKEKSFSCDICDKKFSQYSSMKLHKLIHTGEKPHCCHVCGRKFARKAHLDRHLDTHMERKSYTCEYCSKIYTHKHGFAQHVRSHMKAK